MEKEETEKGKIFTSQASINKEHNDSIRVTSSIFKLKSKEDINNNNNNKKKNDKISLRKLSNSGDNNIFIYNDKNSIINNNIDIGTNSLPDSIYNTNEKKNKKENNRYLYFENEENFDEFSDRNEPEEKPNAVNIKHNNDFNKMLNNNNINFDEMNQFSENRKIMLKNNDKNIQYCIQDDNLQTYNDKQSNKKFIKYKNIDEKKELKNNCYLSYDNDANKSNIFIILFSIGIALSSINIVFCIVLQFYGNQSIYYILGGLSLFIIIIYSFGIKFILRDKKNVKIIIMKNDNPEKIEHSKYRKNILLMIYLLIFAIYFHHVILLINSCFINNIKLSIRGKGYDIRQWTDFFSKKSYTEIMDSFEKTNIFFLVFSWLNEILLMFIVIFKIILMFKYRLIKSIIQVMCILSIQFGIVQFYLSLYCYKFRDVTSLEGIKLSWVTPGTMTNGLIAIFLGIFGFYVFFIEDSKKIFIFQLICFIQFVLLCIFTAGLTDIEDKFYNYKKAKCNSLFKFVSEDYLLKNKLNGCSSKYLFSRQSLNDIICPKDRIMINWEKTEKSNQYFITNETLSINDINSQYEESNQVHFGCINQSCCLQIYFDIKLKFDFLLILCISQIVYFIIILIISIYIKTKISTFLEEEISEKKNILFIFIVTLFLFIFILAFICTLPKSSNQSILNDIKNNEVLDSLSIIQKDLIKYDKEDLYQYTNDSYNSVRNDIINNFKYNIIFDYINKNDYEYELSYFEYNFISSDFDIKLANNKLNQINYYDYNNYSFKNLTKIAFKSKVNIINNIFDYFNLVLYHPLKNSILLDIEINGIFIKNQNNNEIENNNNINTNYNNIIITKENIESKYNIDNGQSIISILKKEIDFSIMDKNELFYIKGNIHNDNGNSLINIYNYNYNNNPIYSTKSNIDGSFEIGPIYKIINNKAIYYLNVEISKIIIENIISNNNNESLIIEKYNEDTNYCKYYDFIKINEYGFHSNYYYLINNILLPKNETGSMDIVGTVVKYNEESELISDVYVKLFYDNQINIVNERIENNIDSIDSNFLNDISLSNTITNKNGEYTFTINKNGQYMIVFINEEYFLEKHIFTINDISSSEKYELGPMQLVNLFNSGKIVVKLEWDYNPPDLDLICRFQVTKDNYCYTFFGNKKCGETEFFLDSREKKEISSEIIEISKFSDYVYLFYVRKYFDSSNGYTLNEDKIDGVEIEPKINYTDIDTKYNEYLNKTVARILIYSNGFKIPALKINIPGFVKNKNTNNETEYNYWIAFCINGKEGMNSLKVINELMPNEPPKNICLSYYDTNDLISFSD